MKPPVAAHSMSGLIQPAHRRMVVTETIVSTLINALIPSAIIWAVHMKPPTTILGANGQLLVLGRATFLATFLMSLIITALVHGRTARGAPRLAGAPGARWAPRPIILRCLFVAACALCTVLPIGVLAAQVVDLGRFSRLGFLGFNLAFGTLIGVGVTPFVVLLALGDTPRSLPSSRAENRASR